MNKKQLESLIEFLYSGKPNSSAEILDTLVVFQDPLLIVKSKKSVLAMFRKLNRLYPKAHVRNLEKLGLQNTQSRWILQVNYGGKNAKNTLNISIFQTELIVESSPEGTIIKITEHWHRPIKLQGDGRHPLNTIWRRGLGILAGVHLSRS